MMRSYLILVCLILWSTAAIAQVDPNDNGIGIYADLGGLNNRVCLEAGEPLEVYLLLTRPTGTVSLAGWECRIVVPDNVAIWGWNLPVPGSLAFSTPPSFMVAFPGIPYQTVNHLMTFIITPLDSKPAQFYIEEFPNTQGVTEPRYLDYNIGHDDTLIDLIPYPDGGVKPSFTINAVELSSDSASWGSMKAIFR